MVGGDWRTGCIVVGQRDGHFVHVSRMHLMRVPEYQKPETLTSTPSSLGFCLQSRVASLRS